MGGQIRVSFPQAFNLPESLRVYAAGGVLGTATSVEASVDPLAKVVSVVVHGGIPQGSLSFSLGDVTTPIGLSAGSFELSTTDTGMPARVFDTTQHHLLNPVDLENWWNGDAMAPAAMVVS